MTKPIFLHVPKTAGSSIRTLITANHAADELLNLYGTFAEIFSQCTRHISSTHRFQLIQGHMPHGVHRYLGERSARYFCFLREPIARTLSDIAFAQRDPEHGFHHVFADPDLTLGERLCKASDIVYYRDHMSHYLSGVFFSQEVTPLEYGRAVDNLWGCAFVGITEHFEESLLIMARRLGWKQVIPQITNVSAGERFRAGAAEIAACKTFLAYDIPLYQTALQIFDQDRRQYGELLSEAAEQMRGILAQQFQQNPEIVHKPYLVGTPLASPLPTPAAGSPLARWIADSAIDPS